MAARRLGFLRGCAGFGILLAAGFVMAWSVPSARAAVSDSAAARQIAELYNVEVLKTRAGKLDGRDVWLVTVMQPGGNRNSAFQVHVLVVDQETGELVSSFQHHSSGYSLPPLSPGGERP